MLESIAYADARDPGPTSVGAPRARAADETESTTAPEKVVSRSYTMEVSSPNANDRLSVTSSNLSSNRTLGTKKIVVIGRGRFGTAAAQGMRKAFVYNTKDQICKTYVVHVSTREFTSSLITTMAKNLRGASFVLYCGYRLPEYARVIADAMKEA